MKTKSFKPYKNFSSLVKNRDIQDVSWNFEDDVIEHDVIEDDVIEDDVIEDDEDD